MADADLQQMREDLDTIRDVVGTELPYGQQDVMGMVFIGVLALITAIVSLVPWGFNPIVNQLLGMMVILGCVGVTVRYYRNKSVRTVQKDRETSRVTVFASVASLLALVFVIWSKIALQLDMAILASIYFYIFGSALFLFALTESRRRMYLAIAVPFLVLGLVRPFIPGSMQFTGIATALSLGAFGCAIAMSRTLRRQEVAVVTD